MKPRSKQILLAWLRVIFAVAVIYFGYAALSQDWSGFLSAVASIPAVNLVLACLAVCSGVLLLGFIWRRIMSQLGFPVAVIPGSHIFFVGQLGKYIPGSVWSLGAQAVMAKSVRVPPRVTVSAGLILIFWAVVTASGVGLVLSALGYLSLPVPLWVILVAFSAAVALVIPPIVNVIYARLSDSPSMRRLDWLEVLFMASLLVLMWFLFGIGVFITAFSFHSIATPGFIAICAAAFAIAYVAGVVTFVAPAGLGAREAVLIGILQPIVGFTAALAVASISRVLHLIADFLFAGGAWIVARVTDNRP